MLKEFFKVVLVPPDNLIIGIFILSILVAWGRPRRWSKYCLVLFSSLLLALSMPIVSGFLATSLQEFDAVTQPTSSAADAIVVLTCGIYEDAPEYGNNNLKGCALERVRYAAKLYRETHLPVMVAGGGVFKEMPKREAVVMKDVLEHELNVPVRWIEPDSLTTLESAHNSWELLSHDDIHRIYLVTHSYHMKRSKYSFERQGFTVIPAPTIINSLNTSIRSFIPSVDAMNGSTLAIHEWVGLLWYYFLK